MPECKQWHIYYTKDDGDILILSKDINIEKNGKVSRKSTGNMWVYNVDAAHFERIKEADPNDLLLFAARCKDEEVREIIKKKLKEVIK